MTRARTHSVRCETHVSMRWHIKLMSNSINPIANGIQFASEEKNMYNDHWVWFAWIEMQTHMTCAISFTRFSFVSRSQYTFKLTHLTGTTFTTPQHIWSASIRYNNSKCTLINWFQSAHSDTHTWFILEGFCREPNKAHHFFWYTTNFLFFFLVRCTK